MMIWWITFGLGTLFALLAIAGSLAELESKPTQEKL